MSLRTGSYETEVTPITIPLGMDMEETNNHLTDLHLGESQMPLLYPDTCMYEGPLTIKQEQFVLKHDCKYYGEFGEECGNINNDASVPKSIVVKEEVVDSNECTHMRSTSQFNANIVPGLWSEQSYAVNMIAEKQPPEHGYMTNKVGYVHAVVKEEIVANNECENVHAVALHPDVSQHGKIVNDLAHGEVKREYETSTNTVRSHCVCVYTPHLYGILTSVEVNQHQVAELDSLANSSLYLDKHPLIRDTAYSYMRIQPCSVVITDIKYTFPESSVYIHDTRPKIEMDVCKDEQWDASYGETPIGVVNMADTSDLRDFSTVKSSARIYSPNALDGCGTSNNNGEKQHVCTLCKYKTVNSSKMRTHAKIHKCKHTRECSVCGVAFSCKYAFTMHMRAHNREKAHLCSVCGASFVQKCGLIRHMAIHTSEKPHKCSVCGLGFAAKGNLKKHTVTHSAEKAYACSVCNARFARKAYLTSHKLTHTGEKPHKCPLCGTGFARRGHLKLHTMTHTGVRPHNCSVCNLGFVQKSGLKEHMHIHTGAKPYTCTICGSGFAHQCNLIHHASVHMGGNTHKCSVCEARFTHKSTLTRHERTHGGEKSQK